MKRFNSLLVFFLFWLACISAAFGQQDAREQALMDAIKANPNDSTAHFNLGVAYFNGTKYDLAISEFQKCLKSNPDDKQAKELMESSAGILAYQQLNYSSAVDHFQNVLKINPKNSSANLFLGDSYVQMKQYPKAEATFKNYAGAFPDDKEVQSKANEGLSKIYMDQKEYAQAVTTLTRAVEANPKDFKAYESLGAANFQMKNYKDAVRYWEVALKFQKDAQTYKFLGFSYYNLGNFNDAINNYKMSIKIESAKDPKEQNIESLGETYYNLAVAYNDNALYDDAAAAFAQAFKINPKDPGAAEGQAQAIESAVTSHMEKGSNYLLNNQYSDAISEWEKVLKYEPNHPEAQAFIADAKAKLNVEVDKHFVAGNAFYRRGDSLKASNEWNKALEMDPSNPKVQNAIKKLKLKSSQKVNALLAEGDELYQEKDYEGALSKYLNAKNISPGNSAIKKRLSKLHKNQSSDLDRLYTAGARNLQKGKLKEALQSLELAKQIDPNNEKIKASLFNVHKEVRNKVAALLQEGASLFESGSKDQAQKKFNEVLGLEPNNEKANEYVKKMTGQQSHEKVDAENAKKLYYDGVNLYINGKIHEAIQTWKECLKEDPGNVNAQKNIDKAMVKLQSIEKLSHS